MPLPVLLDMDPGVDDALAILLAMRCPALDVRAITVCGGNVSAERCALNALKTLDVLECSPAPPVAVGAWRPLRRSPNRSGEAVHGVDGLGDVRDRYPDPDPGRIDPRYAVDLILEVARTCPDRRDPGVNADESLTVIATGPLTNVALAISKDPEGMRRVRRIVWMGGAYACPGNVTPVAEFNAFCDPDAAREVLTFGVPVTAVGLDVTHTCPLGRDRLGAMLDERRSAVLQFAWEISQGYMAFGRDYDGQDACYLHDPLAVGLVAWPELALHAESRHVEVICDPGPAMGMTMIDRRPRSPWTNQTALAALNRIDPVDLRLLTSSGLMAAAPHVDVVLQVNAEQFLTQFLEQISCSKL